MILTNEELKSVFFGAYRFEETEDDYLHPIQFTKRQVDYFKNLLEFYYVRSLAGNAKTIELETTATEIGFDYKLRWFGGLDAVELVVNGKLLSRIDAEALKSGDKINFTLPKGEKNVVIYLPTDAQLVLKNFSINAPFTPAKKGKRVLWIGDSITQGYGPFSPAGTYVSVANRILNYDIINQGIGGYYYDENSLDFMDGYSPDKIIIAMGTNQHSDPAAATKIAAFYKKLNSIYGNIPVLCITPLWRPDLKGEDYHAFVKFCEKITELCGEYGNISVINGLTLIPHLNDYFLDNVHPNALGCEVYGRNLVEVIRKIGF